MFSIIIPLYNKAAYIEKAICSILNQTFQEFELIVVNDGSTDDSLYNLKQIIRNLQIQEPEQYKKIRIIDQENKGVSSSRNNGVEVSKFNYIAFLDADDWWTPTYLEEMKTLIEFFPNAGIYGSNYFIVKKGKLLKANVGVNKNFTLGIINYFKVYSKTLYMPLTSITSIIKKSVFDSEQGFKPNLKLGEDFDLWVRVALKYPVAFLNKPLAYYNQDVEIQHRGVVAKKIYLPECHFIFNLDYLEENEKTNLDLKELLDKLRVYNLLRYRIKKSFPNLVKKEIKKVDFTLQPLSVRLQYHLPVHLIVLWSLFLEIGSKIKSIIKI